MEEEGGEAAKAKKSISYEDYRKMAFLLTKYIKQREELSESESSGKKRPCLDFHSNHCMWRFSYNDCYLFPYAFCLL